MRRLPFLVGLLLGFSWYQPALAQDSPEIEERIRRQLTALLQAVEGPLSRLLSALIPFLGAPGAFFPEELEGRFPETEMMMEARGRARWNGHL